MKASKKATAVDDYIAQFPKDIQERLKEMRATILKAVPDATEIISYSMPAYRTTENLVYFGGFDQHIGFFPTPGAILAFGGELKGYKTSKGTIQLPHDQKLPLGLIAKIVKYRATEADLKAKTKSKN